ncbi:MAG: hypothetical protein QXE31_02420 [Candidatus Woesearchaeota archaeon]
MKKRITLLPTILIVAANLIAGCSSNEQVISTVEGLSGSQVAAIAQQYCGKNIGKGPNENLWYYKVSIKSEEKDNKLRMVVVALQYDGLDFSCKGPWLDLRNTAMPPFPTATQQIPFLARFGNKDLPENQSGSYVLITEEGVFALSEKTLYTLLMDGVPFGQGKIVKIPQNEAQKYSGLEMNVLHVFNEPWNNSEIPDGISQYEVVKGYFNPSGPFEIKDNVSHWTFYTSDGNQIAVQFPTNSVDIKTLEWLLQNASGPSNQVILVGDLQQGMFNVFEVYGILEGQQETSYNLQPTPKEKNDAILAQLRERNSHKNSRNIANNYLERQAKQGGYTSKGWRG